MNNFTGSNTMNRRAGTTAVRVYVLKTMIKMRRMKMRATIVIVLPERCQPCFNHGVAGHTVLLCLVGNLVEPLFGPAQSRLCPIHCAIRIFEQLMVHIELIANLHGELVLAIDGV